LDSVCAWTCEIIKHIVQYIDGKKGKESEWEKMVEGEEVRGRKGVKK